MTGLDLMDLRIFDEIYKTRSLSRAAETVGLSQPTISIRLAQLRKHFDNPLFVRTSTGMQPTPRALELAIPIRQALDVLKAGLEPQAEFNPAGSTRAFTLLMSDIASSAFLPRLMERLRREAPGITVRVLQLSHTAYRAMLETGDADLALGHLPMLKHGFYQQLLWRHGYVCIARTGHPRIGRKLDMERYLECDHVSVAVLGPQGDPVERALARRGLKRKFVLDVPGYLVLPKIVANTDLVATVSESLLASVGVQAGAQDGVRALELPFKVPATEVRQCWHGRFHHDPGNRWLRATIADSFSHIAQGAATRGARGSG